MLIGHQRLGFFVSGHVRHERGAAKAAFDDDFRRKLCRRSSRGHPHVERAAPHSVREAGVRTD